MALGLFIPPMTGAVSNLSVSGTIELTGAISPPTLSDIVNDYNPDGLDGATLLDLTTSDNIEITGIKAPSISKLLFIFNSGPDDIKLKNESLLSLESARMHIGGDKTIQNNESMLLYYPIAKGYWVALGQYI